MLDLVIAARLEDIVKSDDVRLDVNVGMVDRISHTRLRREIDDDCGSVFIKNLSPIQNLQS